MLRDMISEYEHLSQRIERLEHKRVEIYTKRAAVKRFMALAELAERYKRRLNEIDRSVQSIIRTVLFEGEIN